MVAREEHERSALHAQGAELEVVDQDVEGEAGAGFREGKRHCLAEAFAGAGDQGGLPLKLSGAHDGGYSTCRTTGKVISD